MNVVPVPVLQERPVLVEYCQVAPVSKPLMERLALLVTRSVLELPVSAARARPRAEGAVVSTVKPGKEETTSFGVALRRTRTWPVV